MLYRDGISNFIEKEVTASKLGMPYNFELGLVQFQLKQGDVIICGSDGKDDLILNTNILGKRIVNEDHSLFLKVVEDSNGNLNKIL